MLSNPKNIREQRRVLPILTRTGNRSNWRWKGEQNRHQIGRMEGTEMTREDGDGREAIERIAIIDENNI